jgi:hypothetical protein
LNSFLQLYLVVKGRRRLFLLSRNSNSTVAARTSASAVQKTAAISQYTGSGTKRGQQFQFRSAKTVKFHFTYLCKHSTEGTTITTVFVFCIQLSRGRLALKANALHELFRRGHNVKWYKFQIIRENLTRVNRKLEVIATAMAGDQAKT